MSGVDVFLSCISVCYLSPSLFSPMSCLGSSSRARQPYTYDAACFILIASPPPPPVLFLSRARFNASEASSRQTQSPRTLSAILSKKRIVYRSLPPTRQSSLLTCVVASLRWQQVIGSCPSSAYDPRARSYHTTRECKPFSYDDTAKKYSKSVTKSTR